DALRDIEQISNRLAELIGAISNSTQQHAGAAAKVAANMKAILAITQLTTEGTKKTAASSARLTALAEGLRARCPTSRSPEPRNAEPRFDAALLDHRRGQPSLVGGPRADREVLGRPAERRAAAALPGPPAPGERRAAHGRARRGDAFLRVHRGRVQRARRRAAGQR